MTLTISKYQLSKQQHTITLNYTIGENLNHFSHLCRNFFPRIGMRFVKHEMVWLPWQPGPSNYAVYFAEWFLIDFRFFLVTILRSLLSVMGYTLFLVFVDIFPLGYAIIKSKQTNKQTNKHTDRQTDKKQKVTLKGEGISKTHPFFFSAV